MFSPWKLSRSHWQNARARIGAGDETAFAIDLTISSKAPGAGKGLVFKTTLKKHHLRLIFVHLEPLAHQHPHQTQDVFTPACWNPAAHLIIAIQFFRHLGQRPHQMWLKAKDMDAQWELRQCIATVQLSSSKFQKYLLIAKDSKVEQLRLSQCQEELNWPLQFHSETSSRKPVGITAAPNHFPMMNVSFKKNIPRW